MIQKDITEEKYGHENSRETVLKELRVPYLFLPEDTVIIWSRIVVKVLLLHQQFHLDRIEHIVDVHGSMAKNSQETYSKYTIAFENNSYEWIICI